MTGQAVISQPIMIRIIVVLIVLVVSPGLVFSEEEIESQAIRLADRLAVVATDPSPESCNLLPSLLHQLDMFVGKDGHAVSPETRVKIRRNAALARAQCRLE